VAILSTTAKPDWIVNWMTWAHFAAQPFESYTAFPSDNSPVPAINEVLLHSMIVMKSSRTAFQDQVLWCSAAHRLFVVEAVK